jgi:hypothetical protein
VPSWHLMRPVYSAGGRCDDSAFYAPSLYSSSRQQLGQLAGSVPVQSIGRRRAVTYTILMTTRTLPRKQPREANAINTTGITKLGEGPDVAGVTYFLPFCPWAHIRGSVPLYVPPLSYKRGGMQRYKHSSEKRPKSSKTQLKLTSNTTHSGVGYYAPAAQTTLNSCMFLCSSPNLTTSKTLRPLLILGFRAGALRHPAGDFLSDRWYGVHSSITTNVHILHFTRR